MFIKRQHFDVQSIVQVAQRNDFHLVSSAILLSDGPAYMIKLAPRNTEAITSKLQGRPPEAKVELDTGKNQSGLTCGEAEETKPEGTTKG